MKGVITYSFLFLFTSNLLFSQSQTLLNSYKSSSLTVGDSIPDINFANVLNTSMKSFSISKFRGKLLILDFWNSHCASCIESWPKIEKLIKEYSGSVEFLLVNELDDKKTIQALFERSKRVTGISLSAPTVWKDSILGSLFPHSTVPHVIWISETGVVKKITTSVNSRDINYALKNQYELIREKIDAKDLIKPDFKRPLYANGNGGYIDTVFWQSILTKYQPKLWPGKGLVGNDKHGYYASCSGCSIKGLYTLAFAKELNEVGYKIPLLKNRLIFEISDSNNYYKLFPNGEESMENLYTYHLTCPPTKIEKIQEYMQDDLNRYFGVSGKWQKRKIKCLVLSIKDTSKIAYKGGPKVFETITGGIKMNKVSILEFISHLETATNYFFSPYPIFDDTLYKGLLGNINLLVDVNDLKSFNKALEKYSMHLEIKEKDINVVVLKDR